MHAKVNFDDANGRKKSLQLRSGQRVSVGASFSADIVVGNSQGVGGQHAEIYFKNQKCKIKNLTGKAENLLLNGKPTTESVLADGDKIEIGNNLLNFEMETPQSFSRTTATMVAAPVAAAAVAAEHANTSDVQTVSPVETEADAKPPGPQFERCSNGTVVVTVDSFAESVHPLMERPDSPWLYHLICNHRLSKLEGDAPETPNYLADAPADIAESNDLYLVPYADRAAALSEFSTYAISGSGMLAINGPATEGVDAADRMKFLASWFITPASLKFHLLNGSSLLLDKIFNLFDMLVMLDVDGESDLIILNDPLIDGYDSFVEKVKGASNDLGN